MAGPLEGIRVIDLSAVVSGPLAGMLLADQGADVIKIEGPGVGDILRLSNPSRGGLTAFLANCNRGDQVAYFLDLVVVEDAAGPQVTSLVEFEHLGAAKLPLVHTAML